MPVGFNEAGGSPARVHGSSGLLPWVALLHSRSLGCWLPRAWEDSLAVKGLTPLGAVVVVGATASLAPGEGTDLAKRL